MRYSLKTNIISAAIGIIIGLPISIYTENHHTPNERTMRPEVVVSEYKMETTKVINWELDEVYSKDVELIAKCTYAEAGNQSEYGQRLVIDTILNRVDDPDFPCTIYGVITQPNQYVTSETTSNELCKLVIEEMTSRTNSEVLFFNNSGFTKYGNNWKKIGDHYFSTKK